MAGEVRDLRIPDKGPKRKLLDVTEQLVVEKGFDLISVRDVTGDAKANVAAVHYHFGSREGLLGLVIEHVMAPLHAERTRELEGLRGTSGTEDIVGAYVKALQKASEISGFDLSFYLRLVGRILVYPYQSLNETMASQCESVSCQYEDALVRSSPKRREEDVRSAWRFFLIGLGQALVNVSDNSNHRVQFMQWTDFGARLVGNLKEGGKSKKSSQEELLFDF